MIWWIALLLLLDVHHFFSNLLDKSSAGDSDTREWPGVATGKAKNLYEMCEVALII